MRITLTEEQIKKIIEALRVANNYELEKHFLDEMTKNDRASTVKKIDAMEKARVAKSKLVKEKIQNAINLMKLENVNITKSSLSKRAKISRVTVDRYWSEDFVKDWGNN